MSSVRDEILANNRLARMRMGQEVGERVNIPSIPTVQVVQVPLTEAEAQQGAVLAAAQTLEDNILGLQIRNRLCVQSDVFHSIREPSDITKKVFATVEEMTETLEAEDIDFLADNLAVISEYASPAIDGITDEELSELKKAFGETDWSALSGSQWAALKLACSKLFPEILQAKSLGTSSTDSVTQTSESDESTTTVATS